MNVRNLLALSLMELFDELSGLHLNRNVLQIGVAKFVIAIQSRFICGFPNRNCSISLFVCRLKRLFLHKISIIVFIEVVLFRKQNKFGALLAIC